MNLNRDLREKQAYLQTDDIYKLLLKLSGELKKEIEHYDYEQEETRKPYREIRVVPVTKLRTLKRDRSIDNKLKLKKKNDDESTFSSEL